jgi:hypothetical protein
MLIPSLRSRLAGRPGYVAAGPRYVNPLLLGICALFGLLSACAGSDAGTDDGTMGTGGQTATGGATGGSAGGTTGSGGSNATGGITGSGGVHETGGSIGTGGSDATGGSTGTGGASSTGGSIGTGGSAGGGGRGGATGAGGTAGKPGTGGSAGIAGHGAGGSGGVAGGTGGAGSCNVQPVDPQATTQVKNLLCYMYSIYGNHVLSGQQETSWSNPAGDISYYVTNTGKYPAILGGDYLYPSGTTSRGQAYWQAGGLTMMRYHMGAPPMADTYPNSELSTNYANVLTAGTAENASLLSKLDYLAGELKTLQSANVVVIMALFHEVQPNGWFWWAKGTGAQFIQLWEMSFKYLTQTKGVHNVIWLLPFSGSPSSAYFPGKTYVDISGPDEYANPSSQPFSSNYRSAFNIVGSTMPIPLHETGAIPQPSSMFPSTAPWLLWNIWAGYESAAQGGVTYNTVSSIQSAYSSPYTITRDELPKF